MPDDKLVLALVDRTKASGLYGAADVSTELLKSTFDLEVVWFFSSLLGANQAQNQEQTPHLLLADEAEVQDQSG